METKILFQEKQKFNQWWLWLLLLAPTIYIFYKILRPIIIGDATNDGNVSVSITLPMESCIALLILTSVILFVFFMAMTTTIDAEKIVVRHLYFVKKEWYWKDIESAETVKYGFVGYGIRISLNHGMVYNVKGNKGLFIKLKSGKKRLIGTQLPEELIAIVKPFLE